MTTKREIYDLGYERGFNIASWCDLPEIGSGVPRHIDWIGIGKVEHIHDAEEVFSMYCHESESNDRQFSPFEFKASELNTLEETKPYDVWEVFEDGIRKGIEDNWKSRSKDFYS